MHRLDKYSMVVIETFGKRLDARRRPTTVTRQLHAHTPRSMYISACLDFDANPSSQTTTRFACVGLSGTSIQYSPQLFFIRRYKFFASIRRRNSYMVVDGIWYLPSLRLFSFGQLLFADQGTYGCTSIIEIIRVITAIHFRYFICLLLLWFGIREVLFLACILDSCCYICISNIPILTLSLHLASEILW